MPKTSIPKTRKPSGSSKPQTHRVPLQTHNYRLDPYPYPALKTEQGVFTTPPYSGEIKGLWRFKDEQAARESSGEIWKLFERYRDENDFIGADTARKFIQMGRTRSLRYALRRGGKKYTHDPQGEKKEMKRTGEVYDDGKLRGANVFEEVLGKCWIDGWYERTFGEWREGRREASGGKREMEAEAEAEQSKKETGDDDEAAEDLDGDMVKEEKGDAVDVKPDSGDLVEGDDAGTRSRRGKRAGLSDQGEKQAKKGKR